MNVFSDAHPHFLDVCKRDTCIFEVSLFFKRKTVEGYIERTIEGNVTTKTHAGVGQSFAK